ncbi:phage tail tube protein [Bradyrhizobium sp.]|uniref:phage tail tube protein n=1 Tax=Bradyrhizobium sp. TaxID=376 RepID=UPI0025C2C87E|nr:phage tail tube protein [Bradyrhizobium sp.]
MPAGQGIVGRNLILKWNGAPIAGVREKSVAINGEPIDVSADDSVGWRSLLADAAIRQVDISLSGVSRSNVLKTSGFSANARIFPVAIEYPDGGIISGDFFQVTYNETGTYNDAVTFECALQSSGAVNFIPGP